MDKILIYKKNWTQKLARKHCQGLDNPFCPLQFDIFQLKKVLESSFELEMTFMRYPSTKKLDPQMSTTHSQASSKSFCAFEVEFCHIQKMFGVSNLGRKMTLLLTRHLFTKRNGFPELPPKHCHGSFFANEMDGGSDLDWKWTSGWQDTPFTKHCGEMEFIPIKENV